MLSAGKRSIFLQLDKSGRNRLVIFTILLSFIIAVAFIVYPSFERIGFILASIFLIYMGVVVYFIFDFSREVVRLDEAKEFLERLFESSPDSILVIDHSGAIVKNNRCSEKFTKYTSKEMSGMALQELIPEYFHLKLSAIEGSYSPKDSVKEDREDLDLILLQKGGSEVSIDIAVNNMEQADGTLTILNIRDNSDTEQVHSELIEREAMLNQAQSVAKVGCWKWNLISDRVQLSEEAKRIYGIRLKENDFSNEVLSRKVPSKEKEMIANAINEAMFYKKQYHVQHHIITEEEGIKVVEQYGDLSIDDLGVVTSMLGVVKDITEETKSKYEIKLARNVFNHSAEAIIVSDPEKRILKVNPVLEMICGYSKNELQGQQTEILFCSKRHTDEFFKEITRELIHTGLWHGELWCKRKNGDIYPTEQTISVVRDDNDAVIQFIYLLKDITEAKKQREYIQNLAHYDQLTGLPNRVLFMDRIKQAIIRSKRNKCIFALLFIDLDRFKYVNDTLGHDAGDELLTVVSKRLKETVREQDTVARIGGDEFTVILEEIAKQEDSVTVSEKIIKNICYPIDIKGKEVVVGASIGIATYPDHATDENKVIKFADIAMYRAKESGRNQAKMYDETMSSATAKKFQLEMLLRNAIDKEQLELYFQPQINLKTRKVTGCEALVRWNHPEQGIVGPVEFVPLAEDTGLIIPLGQWVLRKSLELYSRWTIEGFEDLTISVNVSRKQLAEEGFLIFIKEALDDYKIAPTMLELEITESAVMDNPSQVIALLNAIRELGVNLSLDDFGTGYSSLSYLKKLPVNKVKIDRSFVKDVNIDKDDEEIVKAIIAMSSSLGLKVIAEGAESKEHIDFIKLTDCEDVQGFYFSRPLPAKDFVEFVCEFNGLNKNSQIN